MTTNVDIAHRLQGERLRMGLTQVQLAQVGEVSKTTQANYESGMRVPDATYLALVAGAGIDVLYVVTGKREHTAAEPTELVPIPRLDVSVSAGHGFVNEPVVEYQVGVISVSRAWLAQRGLSPASLRVIQVRGTSMQGELDDGDLALVDVSDTKPRSGYVYVMRNGDELIVKYCEQMPGTKLRISSANQAFAPYEVDLAAQPDFVVLGRVVASMHDW